VSNMHYTCCYRMQHRLPEFVLLGGYTEKNGQPCVYCMQGLNCCLMGCIFTLTVLKLQRSLCFMRAERTACGVVVCMHAFVMLITVDDSIATHLVTDVVRTSSQRSVEHRSVGSALHSGREAFAAMDSMPPPPLLLLSLWG
jgi:hypothetical protein